MNTQTKTATAGQSKTEQMKTIFTDHLAKFTTAQLAADRGKAFRGETLQDFMSRTNSTPGCATVMFNRVKKKMIKHGVLPANTIGRTVAKEATKTTKGPQRDSKGRFIKRSK